MHFVFMEKNISLYKGPLYDSVNLPSRNKKSGFDINALFSKRSVLSNTYGHVKTFLAEMYDTFSY